MSSSLGNRLKTIDWKDWRVRWVGFSIGAAVLITFFIYILVPEVTKPETFAGSVFASWLAGVGLSVVVTVAIALTSLARPEKEVFEARARNLLERQTGPHIDYMIPRLQKLLEPYCESILREMAITEYDAKTEKFRINQLTKTNLRSYLNDIAVDFKSHLIYRNCTTPPSGHEDCSLTYLKVDDETVFENIEIKDKIEEEFDILVRPHQVCTIEHRMVFWVKANDEKNRHLPNRYTKNLEVSVQNHLPSQDLKIFVLDHVVSSDVHTEVFPSNGCEGRSIQIPAGGSEQIISQNELQPNDFVYDFRISIA